MKKLYTLFLATILAGSTFGQGNGRINSIEFKTQEDVVINPIYIATMNPTNNNATVSGMGVFDLIFLPGTDLSDVQATITTNGVNSVIKTPVTVPTDWTLPVDVEIENGSNTVYYKACAKVLTPASLPFTLATGSESSFNSTSWEWDTTTDAGWAGAGIQKNINYIQLGSASRGFFIAFNDVPDELEYTIGGSGNWADGNTITVDGSSDGLNWTNITTYNDANPFDNRFAEAIPIKTTLNENIRYVRWIFSTRANNLNTNIGNISVSKKTETGILTPQENTIKISVNENKIQLTNAALVSNLSLYNITGGLAISLNSPSSLIDASNIDAGIYIAKITTTTGNTVSTKLIKNSL